MDLPAQSGRCHAPVDGSLEVQSDKPSLVRMLAVGGLGVDAYGVCRVTGRLIAAMAVAPQRSAHGRGATDLVSGPTSG